MQLQKAVFLDRDGVLNQERGDYTYQLDNFLIEKNVAEALKNLNKAGFLLIVVTNQGGIAKGIYTKTEVQACHQKLQNETGNLLDALYYSPYHEQHSHSLSRKPDSLMLEKAIAKFKIDASASWIVGDSQRDIMAGEKVGIKGILVSHNFQDTDIQTNAVKIVENLWQASQYITQAD
jgi:D-glycero-D-manno-heptose 1,7-bisphosphate phosphatase